MWWSKERINWYSQAVAYTPFPKTLCKFITPYLEKTETIAEFGCGLGYVSEELYNLGYNIKGYDIDEEALNFAKDRSKLPIFFNRDCTFNIPYSEVILAIFFGHFNDKAYLSSCLEKTNKLIILSNLHKGKKVVTKNASNINDTLKQLQLNYTQQTLTLPFPQPFTSYEDALEFINNYYPEHKELVEKELIIKNGQYILNNNKSILMTVINKEY